MNTTMLAPAVSLPEVVPADHAATLRRLAELALTRHQEHVAQRAAANLPPRLVFLRAALRCAAWFTRRAQTQDAPAAITTLAPLVPLLAAIATAAEEADVLDEVSGTCSGQPLNVWITCVTKQSQVDQLLQWAREEVAQRASAAAPQPKPSSAADLAKLDARLAALIKESAHLLGGSEADWDDLLGDDDALGDDDELDDDIPAALTG